MSAWFIRDFELEDLEAALQLEVRSSTAHEVPLFGVAQVVESVQKGDPAVVAVAGGTVIGTTISRVDGDHAWIIRIALSPEWRQQGLGSAMLGEVEHRLLTAGVRRLSALLPDSETGSTAFTHSGFVARDHVTYYEKVEVVSPAATRVLSSLGGVLPAAGLWQQVAGMTAEKDLIERRIVLPLSQPELAAEHGVQPPRAVILFGPPGTGKTTFARAVASRLSWPFVELFPSRLATSDGGLAAGISDAFGQLSALDHAVVFIDEVEEIASARTAGGGSVTVVNELLKALVSFRERSGRLLICATNSVSELDPAFLRHGRFDFVLPIGPPDDHARRALWARYVGEANEVDLDILVAASSGFTPADIAHAAQSVAQTTFEATVEAGTRQRPVTTDFTAVIDSMRPTLTADMTEAFTRDIDAYARR